MYVTVRTQTILGTLIMVGAHDVKTYILFGGFPLRVFGESGLFIKSRINEMLSRSATFFYNTNELSV